VVAVAIVQLPLKVAVSLGATILAIIVSGAAPVASVQGLVAAVQVTILALEADDPPFGSTIVNVKSAHAADPIDKINAVTNGIINDNQLRCPRFFSKANASNKELKTKDFIKKPHKKLNVMNLN
jgi:hypothetical protein